MRQIFSVRFFAAVGAVAGLVFVLSTIFATRDVAERIDRAAPIAPAREVDFVETVISATNPAFDVVDGVVTVGGDLVIDARRRLTVTAGTPGEMHCDVHGPLGDCAVVADLIGEAVVWFALVPDGPGSTVEFPAIDVLDSGRATLVNRWRLPYAPVLDRRCRDDRNELVEFGSYREFRSTMGDDFVSVFDTVERRLVAVECRRRVPFAPEPEVTSTPATSTSVSSSSGPAGDVPIGRARRPE